MQHCLHGQIGRNVHAYMDDIAVMYTKSNDLISDLKETFDNLQKYNMMLNPKKCVFGVPARRQIVGLDRFPAWNRGQLGENQVHLKHKPSDMPKGHTTTNRLCCSS